MLRLQHDSRQCLWQSRARILLVVASLCWALLLKSPRMIPTSTGKCENQVPAVGQKIEDEAEDVDAVAARRTMLRKAWSQTLFITLDLMRDNHEGPGKTAPLPHTHAHTRTDALGPGAATPKRQSMKRPGGGTGGGMKRPALRKSPAEPSEAGSGLNEPEPEAEERESPVDELPVLKKPACKEPKVEDAGKGDEAAEPSRSVRNKLLRTEKFGDWTVEWYQRGTGSEGSAVKVVGSYSKYISPEGEVFWSKKQAMNNGFAEV